jgi:hypothetical protein
VPELTPAALAVLLKKLDDVCRQAQELAAEIKNKMAETKRADFQSTDSARADRRATTRKNR